MKKKSKISSIFILLTIFGFLNSCDEPEDIKPLEEIQFEVWVQVNNKTSDKVFYWTTDYPTPSSVSPMSQTTRRNFYRIFRDGSKKINVSIKSKTPPSSGDDIEDIASFTIEGKGGTVEKIYDWNGKNLILK